MNRLVEYEPGLPTDRLREKMGRDDVEKYKAEFLFRQRILNERAVDWAGCVKPGSKILDACAGPEGSYLAVSRRQGSWVGNELSFKTAKHLKDTGAQVVLGTADKLALKDGSIDTAFYIFALNNIENTEGALEEAKRVLRSRGHIVICDPGQNYWAIDLYLYHALIQNLIPNGKAEIIKNSYRFSQIIPEYYSTYPHRDSPEQLAHTLNGLYGMTWGEMVDIIKQAAADTYPHRSRKSLATRFCRNFYDVMGHKYYSHIVGAASQNSFILQRLGMISAFRSNDSSEWDVTSIYDVDLPDKLEQVPNIIRDIRNNRHSLSSMLVHRGQNISHNIISPIFLFEKNA